MAAQDFTVLHSPEFPQVFDRALAQLDRLVTRTVSLHFLLSQCDFEDEHCNCRAQATVHHLESEKEYCERHFQAVCRG